MTSATLRGHVGLINVKRFLQINQIIIMAVFAVMVLSTPGVREARIGNFGILTAIKLLFLARILNGKLENAVDKAPPLVPGNSKVTVPSEIKPEEIKTGDLLLIDQLIDWKTGKVTILGITVLPQK